MKIEITDMQWKQLEFIAGDGLHPDQDKSSYWIDIYDGKNILVACFDISMKIKQARRLLKELREQNKIVLTEHNNGDII